MNKEQLESDLAQRKSLSELKIIYGKPQNTIRYWIKKYNLIRPCKTCDGALKGNQSSFCSQQCRKEFKKNQYQGRTHLDFMESLKRSEIDWEKVQKFYDDNHTFGEILSEFNTYATLVGYAIKVGKLKMRSSAETSRLRGTLFHTHTEETKKILSTKRKEWLNANPDKHVWKRHSKFKSVPCERLKEIIRSMGIEFVEEEVSTVPEATYFRRCPENSMTPKPVILIPGSIPKIRIGYQCLKWRIPV